MEVIDTVDMSADHALAKPVDNYLMIECLDDDGESWRDIASYTSFPRRARALILLPNYAAVVTELGTAIDCYTITLVCYHSPEKTLESDNAHSEGGG